MSETATLKSIGERLKTLRGRASRQEFADRFHVSPSSLQRWEGGNSPPDLFFLNKLSIEFDVSMEWLVSGRNEVSVKGKTADGRQFPKTEPIENIEYDSKRTADIGGSTDLLKEQEKELLTLYRENTQLVREIADLRAENSRLQSQLAAAVGALGKSTAGVTSANAMDKAG